MPASHPANPQRGAPAQAETTNRIRQRRRRLLAKTVPLFLAAVLIVLVAMFARDTFRRGHCRRSLTFYSDMLAAKGFDLTHASEMWMNLPEQSEQFLPRSHYQYGDWPLPNDAGIGPGKVLAYCKVPHEGWILPAGRHLLIWHNQKFRVVWVSERQFRQLGIEP